ncbi:hypothetical protein L226DRAFT_361953 [Lentinus tigrinus ALCF2SS1-7]|uniref:uncharacterized protein n=1 Tax=Lentinus tigrinus ALCF2SS1-7 TaxID=1328758 RepID=UPI0011662053|nr:hypothetical protein L226DRAFT_361953 [Lentinus tigrinus ALCF2SS1-7]
MHLFLFANASLGHILPLPLPLSQTQTDRSAIRNPQSYYNCARRTLQSSVVPSTSGSPSPPGSDPPRHSNAIPSWPWDHISNATSRHRRIARASLLLTSSLLVRVHKHSRQLDKTETETAKRKSQGTSGATPPLRTSAFNPGSPKAEAEAEA